MFVKFCHFSHGHITNRFNVAARNGQISGLDNEAEQRDILKLSHGVALVLLPSEFRFPLKLLLPEQFIDGVLLC